ncbi:hypothetical protein KZX46_15710 [Polymorphobacter sp. PAMC 29334]|uniref:hypothetical protein n=1 Tax=Polymorphobacter sp. PAMC 29334 TaxID=2862331 RepID=UPI001C78A652|nr:hypothetical protein [Polymorphobacter sp. PAMC 29334]QYE34213.1 hypothetical protein KZX46_15710 [Polymorphobacter sp. PAMC 29334]
MRRKWRSNGCRTTYESGECREFGWTKHHFDWLPQDGEREQKTLYRPKQTVGFLGIFDDRAPRLTLIQRPDGHLLAELDLCNARGDICRAAYQDWVPIDAAAMVD